MCNLEIPQEKIAMKFERERERERERGGRADRQTERDFPTCNIFIFFISGDSGTEDAVVEGSGEITAHTDRVPVIEDELSATQAPANLSNSTRVEAPDDESKTKETEIVDGGK